MVIKYPTSIDTDAEIPRIDDNISEIGGDVINLLRSAVFAIEKALGRLPQGSATDLVTRLGVSLDANGYIKASALAGIGLVTLPITDSQVGTNAGIEESKLDLNYGTTLLKFWIDSLRVRVDALEIALAQDISNLSQHVAHPALWGRHTSGDVDAYGVFTGKTVQGALTELDTRLIAHIIDPIDAHDGSAISLDPNRFTTITADNVQDATEQLENLQLVEVIRHRDRQHGNGILNSQDAFISGTDHGVTIIAPATTTSGTVGSSFIKFAVAPTPADFALISRNDRIDLIIGGRTYRFIVDSTQSTNQVNIFGQLPVSGTGVAAVYRNSEETSEPSPAIVCMRRPSTLQIAHPSAPYVLSNGFRGSDLTATIKSLRLKYRGGDTGDLDVYTAMTAFSATPSTWTAENVARVINYSLLSPGIGSTRYPIIAFSHNGELGFAYDSPQDNGFIEVAVAAVPANDAAATLGFSYGVSYAVSSRNLYIDGYEIPSLRLLIDAYGQITSGDTITFPSINPLASAVKAGQVAHVSVFETGTYIINSVTSTAVVFDSANEHDFSSNINKWVQVRIWADAFSVAAAAAPIQRTLYEVFLDGYHGGYGPEAELKASTRVQYVDTSGGGAGLEVILDVTGISRTFGSSLRRAFYDFSARTLVLGTRAAGPSISNIGVKVALPSTSEAGFCFSLYDANNVDYINFEIVGSLPGSDGYLDITTYPRISEERFLQLATVLHNRTTFGQLIDTREFGNVGRQDVRDDFTRDYVSYPRSLLRGNGVIKGFEASGTGTSVLSVIGGEALVDGQIKSVGGATFTIPADGVATYNLLMDTDGSLRLMRDNYFASSVLSTPSIAEILAGRTQVAFAQVVVNSSNVITSITDVRRFVGDVDGKLDILVEEDGIDHGSFASLESAAAYLSALSSGNSYSRKIRIRGNVLLAGSVTLPDYTILEGDGIGPSSTGARITFTSAASTIVLGTGNIVRDLSFYRSGTLTSGFISSGSAVGIRIEDCDFAFLASAAGNNAIVMTNLQFSHIRQCALHNVDVGISITSTSNYNNIKDNTIFQVLKNGIVISSSLYDTISGNNIVTTSATIVAGSSFIGIGSNIYTRITDNFMLYGGTQVAAANMAMIDISSASSVTALLIERNFLKNVASTTNGFAVGMRCDPTTASSIVVRDNVFIDLYVGTIGRGLVLSNCSNAMVSGNTFSSCRNSISIDKCPYVMVLDNTILSRDVVGADSSALWMTGNTTNMFHVCGNYIANLVDTSGFGDVQLVDIYTNARGGVVSGNTFQSEATGASTYGLLSVTQDDCLVTGNIFSGGTFNNNVVAIALISDNCLVAFNNVVDTTMSPATNAKIYYSNATTIDIFNKGQTYYVDIPLSTASADYLGGLDQTCNFGSDIGKTVLYTTGSSGLISEVEFSGAHLPFGATFVSVSITYGSAAVSPNSSFDAGWNSTAWNGDTLPVTSVVAATSCPGTGNIHSLSTIVLTPATTTVMGSGEIHNVYFTTTSADATVIHGVRVAYKL